jgi:hypothetical protein
VGISILVVLLLVGMYAGIKIHSSKLTDTKRNDFITSKANKVLGKYVSPINRNAYIEFMSDGTVYDNHSHVGGAYKINGLIVSECGYTEGIKSG